MTQVVLDDIIFRLQQFGGASDFWRQLTNRLSRDESLEITRVAGSRFSRPVPIVASADVVHSSHFRVPLRRSTACVTTIHDLTYELGMNGGLGRRLNLWERSNSVKRADAIVCISEHTKNALLSHYDDRIPTDAVVTTIHHGRTYETPMGDDLPTRFHGRGRFLLHVGNRRGYKNFSTALRAYAASDLPKERVGLWCTGSAFDEQELAEITSLRLDDTLIRNVGVVTTAELGLLYEHAVALVYPSRYEGFGLPPLDAMSLGCPVVASDASSVPEIVGDGGILLPPDDEASFAEALTSLLDDQVRDDVRERGRERSALFDWDHAATSYSELYRTLAG